MIYKIYFYVPKDSVEKVKNAMFKAGAGKIGKYQKCSWQVEGVGQFEPMEGANPAIGSIKKIEKVPEYLVEMVCEKQYIKDVLKVMKKAHPYEEVAYGVVEILTYGNLK